MEVRQQDITVLRQYIDRSISGTSYWCVLQHDPSGITVKDGGFTEKSALNRATAKLTESVRAYNAAVIYCWAAPGIERITKPLGLADLIDKGWLTDLALRRSPLPIWHYPVDQRLNDLLTFEAETWLEEHQAKQPSEIVKLLMRHSVGFDVRSGKHWVDFDTLRMEICQTYAVKRY